MAGQIQGELRGQALKSSVPPYPPLVNFASWEQLMAARTIWSQPHALQRRASTRTLLMPHPPLEQRSLLSRVGGKGDAAIAAEAHHDGAEGDVLKPTKKMVIDAEGKTYGRYNCPGIPWPWISHNFPSCRRILKAPCAHFQRAHHTCTHEHTHEHTYQPQEGTNARIRPAPKAHPDPVTFGTAWTLRLCRGPRGCRGAQERHSCPRRTRCVGRQRGSSRTLQYGREAQVRTKGNPGIDYVIRKDEQGENGCILLFLDSWCTRSSCVVLLFFCLPSPAKHAREGAHACLLNACSRHRCQGLHVCREAFAQAQRRRDDEPSTREGQQEG
jgi:hypothetical protein